MKLTHDAQASVTIDVEVDGYGPLRVVIASLDIAYHETRLALEAMIGKPVEDMFAAHMARRTEVAESVPLVDP